jgi:hypothetical protein
MGKNLVFTRTVKGCISLPIHYYISRFGYLNLAGFETKKVGVLGLFLFDFERGLGGI